MFKNAIPLWQDLQGYSGRSLSKDLVAASVVTIMLIPQSLAYALLAGVPAEVGLYASILPLIAYALFGSSKSLAVGPVAITSLMTASALAQLTQAGVIGYLPGAILLATLSGIFLLLLGLLRMGFLSHFLSHSVVAGFITASGLLIALSQFRHILGVEAGGHNFFQLGSSLADQLLRANSVTVVLGIACIAFLLWARNGAARLLQRLGVGTESAIILSRIAPIVGVVLATVVVANFALHEQGVAIVGQIPTGLPTLALPQLPWEAVKQLFMPALFISIIGYVESVSVGKTLAAKKQQRVDGNKELVGLGAANLAAGFSGGFPVTGGFSRSVVNFDAGAETQLAGIFTAIGIALAALFLTPLMYHLPNAMLAATIIVAVLSLLDFSVFRHAWHFSRSDFWAVLVTVLITLVLGVEAGVAAGIGTSILLHLYHTSRPHIAEVGLIGGTEFFRNVQHYQVKTVPHLVSLRIDESLLFSNAGYLEDYINKLVFERDQIAHLVLQCSAINNIDLTSLEMLERLDRRLAEQGIQMHLSEVKIPVAKLLQDTELMKQLSGQVFLSQYQAYKALGGAD